MSLSSTLKHMKRFSSMHHMTSYQIVGVGNLRRSCTGHAGRASVGDGLGEVSVMPIVFAHRRVEVWLQYRAKTLKLRRTVHF